MDLGNGDRGSWRSEAVAWWRFTILFGGEVGGVARQRLADFTPEKAVKLGEAVRRRAERFAFAEAAARRVRLRSELPPSPGATADRSARQVRLRRGGATGRRTRRREEGA